MTFAALQEDCKKKKHMTIHNSTFLSYKYEKPGESSKYLKKKNIINM